MPVDAGGRGARPVLMVVDDQPDVRLLLRLTLRNTDFELQEFGDGDSFMAAAIAAPPAVVLLDVMLTGPLDGLDICRRLRAMPAFRDTRIVMLSARAQAGDVEAGLNAGADAYLTKPFSPAQLVHTVHRLVGPPAA
jgi:DNA-binding response OmpR family regulator